jgi:hypothetical protein
VLLLRTGLVVLRLAVLLRGRLGPDPGRVFHVQTLLEIGARSSSTVTRRRRQLVRIIIIINPEWRRMIVFRSLVQYRQKLLLLVLQNDLISNLLIRVELCIACLIVCADFVLVDELGWIFGAFQCAGNLGVFLNH